MQAGTEPRVAAPLQPAKNQQQLKQGIDSISADGGTNAYVALERAYRELASVRAKVKHVILLSDGQSPGNCLKELVKQMSSDGITISTVAIGDADRLLLGMIAQGGSGRPYSVNDTSKLAQVFVAEVRQARSGSGP